MKKAAPLIPRIRRFKNRKEEPLPDEPCIILIYKRDVDGPYIHECLWLPHNKESIEIYEREGLRKPGEGYLGTAIVIKPPHEGIGFHAWAQNDSEFLYYKKLNGDVESWQSIYGYRRVRSGRGVYRME